MNQAKGQLLVANRVRDKDLRKLAELVNEETEDLIINADPAILQYYPKSTEFAMDNNLTPHLAGNITGMGMTVLTQVIKKQTDNVFVHKVMDIAATNKQLGQIIDVIGKRAFNRGNKEESTKGEPKERKDKKKKDPQDGFTRFA